MVPLPPPSSRGEQEDVIGGAWIFDPSNLGETKRTLKVILYDFMSADEKKIPKNIGEKKLFSFFLLLSFIKYECKVFHPPKNTLVPPLQQFLSSLMANVLLTVIIHTWSQTLFTTCFISKKSAYSAMILLSYIRNGNTE